MSKDREPMTEEEKQIQWIKNRAGLVVTIMKQKFEENVYDGFEKQNFQSIEEMDEWVGEKLLQFENEKKAVKAYYDELVSEITD